MPKSEIENIINSFKKPNLIILTNCDTLYFDGIHSDTHLNKNEHLVIEHTGIHNEKKIFVPYDDIADLIYVPLKQQKQNAKSPPENPYNSPLSSLLYGKTLGTANKREYTVSDVVIMYSLTPPEDFSWGDVNFQDDVPLYCDWEYLQHRSSGINSLGGGAFGFNLSTSWDDSLWSEFKDKVDGTQTAISDVDNYSEASILGYLNFARDENDYVTKEMEGSEWIAGVVSSKYIEQTSELYENEWTVVFLKRDSLMFPLDAWEHITDQIILFGEVINTSINIGFGEVNEFLKIRAGAYID